MTQLNEQQWKQIEQEAARKVKLPHQRPGDPKIYDQIRDIAVSSAIEVLKAYQSHLDE